MALDTKTQRLQELTEVAPKVSVKMDMEWLGSTLNTAYFESFKVGSTDNKEYFEILSVNRD